MFKNFLYYYFFPTLFCSYLIWLLLNPFLFNQFCIISILSIISWTIAYYFYEKFNQDVINSHNKIVLVTGCDTGFGNRTAYGLDQLGFHVYAGVLNPDGDGSRSLQEKCSKRLKILKMDVTNPDDVNFVVEQIKQSNMPLWAIVNNAGIGFTSPFDWGNDIDIHQKTFNVNVFGVIRVTKYCISLLRKSNGRIINIASLAGRVQSADISHYCMAKHSVRVFSDCLRRELVGTDIKIITIEPSFYQTEIVNKKKLEENFRKFYNETPTDIRMAYGDNYCNYLVEKGESIKSITKTRIDDVVDAIIDGVLLVNPKLYYRCCYYWEVLVLWATSHLPELIVDNIYSLTTLNRLKKMKCGPFQTK